MSITTYGELKTEIAEWMHRDDLTSKIPDFVKMAESRIANDIRCKDQHTRSIATISTQYVDLPPDFLELRDIQINSDPIQPLTYLTPKVLSEKYPSATTGKPQYYTMHGDEFEFKPIPSTEYEIEISYIKRYASFSTDASYNWLLTNYPNIYLYGSLWAGFLYVMDRESAVDFLNLYKEEVVLLMRAEKAAKYGGVIIARVNVPTP